jgi:hypothetical protein
MKKTSSNGELSAEQKAFVRQVVKDPVLFAKSILGVYGELLIFQRNQEFATHMLPSPEPT